MKKYSLLVLALLFGVTSIGATSKNALALSGENELKFKTKIYEKDSLTSEEKNYCNSSVLNTIGSVTKNKYIKVNGIDNPLYCTFTNQEQALENIKLETADLLDIIAKEYQLEPMDSSNWKEYRIKLNEFFKVPTTEYNESNMSYIKLRAFFDIYENEESNQEILDYVNEQKLNSKSVDVEVSQVRDVIELGLLFPSYAPIAQQSESTISKVIARATINVQPAVNYANTYATNRNTPNYASLSDTDCTNFVSQILEASGIPQNYYESEHSGWWHTRQKVLLTWVHKHSRSWIVPDVFARYMGVTYKTKNHSNFSANILVGDFISVDWTSDGDWDHSGFVTARDDYSSSWNGSPAYYDYKVAQHTPDYNAWTSSSTNGWEDTSDGRTYARVRR